MVGGLRASSGPPTMSTLTAAIFIFNLVVGTGALALPAAFQKVCFVINPFVPKIYGLNYF